MQQYRRHESEVSLHMSHFLSGYLKEIHRQFNGDLGLVIVLAEIAHHSTALHFRSEHGLDRDLVDALRDGSGKAKDRMPACNAFSLAQSTGLPRETVRRKILELEKRGWVERSGRREVRITAKVGEVFLPDFNVRILSGLLRTADRIRTLLSLPQH